MSEHKDPKWMTQLASCCTGTHGEVWNAVVQLDTNAPFFSLVDEPGYQAISYTEKHRTHGTTIAELIMRQGIAEVTK